jgi:hypothetical protein
MTKQSKFRRRLLTRAKNCDRKVRSGFWWANDIDKPRLKKKRQKLTLDERIRRELEAER